MNTCRDCEYWGDRMNDSYDYKPTLELHSCLSPHTHDISVMEQRKIDTLPANVMTSIDGEGYESEILTGPDFGCVNFKAKEQS